MSISSFCHRKNTKTLCASFLVIGICSAGVAGRSASSSSSLSSMGTSIGGSRGGAAKVRSPYHLYGLGNEYSSRSSSTSKTKDFSRTDRSGREISTVQIISILTIIMSLGFAGYYFIQFYPFICSKESKYDVMSRSSVTPTQSREFEYEESTSSATKSTNASYSNEHDV